MTYRYFKVTAIVAVEQYGADELCGEHSHLGHRCGLDAVDLLADGDDYLLDISEEELHLVPKPNITVINEGQGPLIVKKKRV